MSDDMDMEEGHDGGGGGGAPSADKLTLTREQVMAQRAEKKKLKEARKNKGGGDGVVGGGSGGGGKVPFGDRNLGGDSNNNEDSKGNGGRGKSQGVPVPVEVPTAEKKQQEVPMQPSKVQEAPAAPPKIAATAKVLEDPTTTASSPGETPVPKHKTGASTSTLVDSGSKSRTADKGVGVQVESPEFLSSIKSLFKINLEEKIHKPKGFHLHPLFYNLGVKLRNSVIRDANQRCIALLNAVKEYARVYESPPTGKSFKHSFAEELRTNLDVLRGKSPFGIGMTNAVDVLTSHLCKTEHDNSDTLQLREEILDVIDQYIEEKIEKAVEAIVLYGLEKIESGDVIMIYSMTEALLNLVEKAAEGGCSFDLVVLHTPETMLDVPVLLKKLGGPINNQSVRISYVTFSNAIYRMRHCTKIIIGGHGLFGHGGVMAQSGSGELALLASTQNKPAIFLCETYKFCDRSPLDFFTLDEYMPPPPELSSKEGDGLFKPKIKYDVTPANLVTVVITDIDMLPSTSVPVVLRVQEWKVPKTTCEKTSDSRKSLDGLVGSKN